LNSIKSPPDRYFDGVEVASMDTESKTASSERTNTNLSNYSSESILNEATTSKFNRPQRLATNNLNKPKLNGYEHNEPKTALLLNNNNNGTAGVGGGGVGYSKVNIGNTNRLSGSHLKSKLEKKRKENDITSKLMGIERETSSESLKVKMKRSESWDSKNKIYLK
jgi:hypothetical protein